MGTYTPDGGVVSSKSPRAGQSDAHYRMFGLYRGQVIKTVYPDDDDSITGNRMEYVVRVRGQDYPNAINMREAGGIYNYSERIRKPVEKSTTGQLDDTQYPENLDGEMVWVMMVEGNGDIPIIVGGDTPPLHSAYKNPQRSDGLFEAREYNGVEIAINNAGDYTITQVGLKDKDGEIQNEDAVGSQIAIMGVTGNVVVTALGSTVTIDENGIAMKDGNGNSFTMSGASVDTESGADIVENAKGKFTASAGADVSVTGKGNGTFSGKGGTAVGDTSSQTQVQGQMILLAGGGTPVARLGDMCVGTGNLGAPVISTILQGSPKVTSA